MVGRPPDSPHPGLRGQLRARSSAAHLPDDLPGERFEENGLRGDVAYELIHAHLMLDGNARLNLATFVGTWMEPEARRLMEECGDKNIIDKDEYPQTTDLERRCLRMLADLWHAPDPSDAVGTSTTGSSEGCMLAGLVLRWHWRQRHAADGPKGGGPEAGGGKERRPNLVMGANRQVCWDKFCAYFDVEPRFLPLSAASLHLEPEAAAAACDDHTIGVVAVLGSVVDGSYEPVAAIAAALDALQERTGLAVPLHVDAASGGFVAPFNTPELVWDFQLARVWSINASGHKYGGVLPGVGWVLWRHDALLPAELRFDVNYLGGVTPTIGMNFSRPGAQVVGQYYNFIHLGRHGYRHRMQALEAIACHLADGIAAIAPLRLVNHPLGQLPVFCVELDQQVRHWNVFHLADKLRERGWLVPAYSLPANQAQRSVLRFVVRAGFTRPLAEELLSDIARDVAWFESLVLPMPKPMTQTAFRHG
jgi:glutamate decarboxylase